MSERDDISKVINYLDGINRHTSYGSKYLELPEDIACIARDLLERYSKTVCQSNHPVFDLNKIKHYAIGKVVMRRSSVMSESADNFGHITGFSVAHDGGLLLRVKFAS